MLFLFRLAIYEKDGSQVPSLKTLNHYLKSQAPEKLLFVALVGYTKGQSLGTVKARANCKSVCLVA